ncbi:MAG TPA: TolC family protein, partial [Phycisphaerae bacterium]
TRVSAGQQGVTEAEELLRITRLRLQAGTGVPADDLRAQARLAERRQELIAAVNAFYNASVALATTLRLEPTLTLVPKADALPPVTLVRDDLDLDDLLGLAVAYRPDLERVRALVEAAAADRGATWWGAFGPQFQVSYQIGGITGHANHVNKGQGIPGNLIVNPLSPNGSFSTNPLANGLIRENLLRGSRELDPDRDQTFGFSDQQRFSAGAGWRWSVSAFGDLKASRAAEKQAVIEAERRLDQVKAQVVMTREASRASSLAIPLAHDQLTAAEESLRLSEANLRVGTMTTLDVLVAQDAVMRARLSYAAAVVGYNQAQVALLAAIGVLDQSGFNVAP